MPVQTGSESISTTLKITFPNSLNPPTGAKGYTEPPRPRSYPPSLVKRAPGRHD
jgi:hypothetical protein